MTLPDDSPAKPASLSPGSARVRLGCLIAAGWVHSTATGLLVSRALSERVPEMPGTASPTTQLLTFSLALLALIAPLWAWLLTKLSTRLLLITLAITGFLLSVSSGSLRPIVLGGWSLVLGGLFVASQIAVVEYACRLGETFPARWLGAVLLAAVGGLWCGFHAADTTPSLMRPSAVAQHFLLAILLVIPAAFSLVERSRDAGRLTAFLSDCFRDRITRRGLLTLLGWSSLLVLTLVVRRETDLTRSESILLFALGVFLGSLYWHPSRTAVNVPIAFVVLCVYVCRDGFGFDRTRAVQGCLVALGMMLPPTIMIILWSVSSARQAAMVGLIVPPALVPFAALRLPGLTAEATGIDAASLLHWCVPPLTVLVIYAYSRSLAQLLFESLILLSYKVRIYGPGLWKIPSRGSGLLIANHASWLDPFWLAKSVPCETTPMMISTFYDLPVIRFLMRTCLRVIRVQAADFRREAPEIQEAIAAIDRGEVVLLFPEGWLRRHEEKPIRRFAKGVWQILSARPDTPVYPCWIEGTWGSMTSWKDGPPLKNKPLDIRRPIDIAVGEPIIVPKEILKKHHATRAFLLERVLEARAVMGLPPITPTTAEEKSED